MVAYISAQYRRPIDSDLGFIYNTFIRHLVPQEGSKGIHPYNKIERPLMSVMAHSLMTRMLRGCNTLIICNEDDLDQIFGYIIFKDDDLYWIYVKYDFRKIGLATDAIEKVFGDHQINIIIPTPAFNWMSKKWNMVLRPGNILQLRR